MNRAGGPRPKESPSSQGWGAVSWGHFTWGLPLGKGRRDNLATAEAFPPMSDYRK